MGSGSYWAVIYGCKDFRMCCDSDDIANNMANNIAEILDDLDCRTSNEGTSQYAGIGLLTTDGAVIGIDSLPTAIRKAISAESLKKARAVWTQAQEAATARRQKLPDGRLLWLGDYD